MHLIFIICCSRIWFLLPLSSFSPCSSFYLYFISSLSLLLPCLPESSFHLSFNTFLYFLFIFSVNYALVIVEKRGIVSDTQSSHISTLNFSRPRLFPCSILSFFCNQPCFLSYLFMFCISRTTEFLSYHTDQPTCGNTKIIRIYLAKHKRIPILLFKAF